MRRALIAFAGTLFPLVLGGCFKGTQSVRPDSAGPLVESEIRGLCNVGYSGGAAGSSLGLIAGYRRGRIDDVSLVFRSVAQGGSA